MEFEFPARCTRDRGRDSATRRRQMSGSRDGEAEAEIEAVNIRKTSETDQDRIEQGEWTDCWICEDVFRRRTQTKRYCAKCHRGFCEGWHGSLDRGYGTCIICWADTDSGSQ